MPTQHVINVMHVEWNIADSMLQFLLKEKDILECQRDMEELGVMRNLQRFPNRSMYIKPCVLYVLTSIKKRQILEVVGNIEMPTRFAANFSEHFRCDGFMGLKSHDLHCMIQHIKPVCSCTLLQLFQHTTLIRLVKCFTRLMCKGHGPCKDTCAAMSFCC